MEGTSSHFEVHEAERVTSVQHTANFFGPHLLAVSHQVLGAKYNQQGQAPITATSAC